ncbi:MAG: T9SS type A sorting domain-containing protein [Paludibacteraceae bacterium]|nr:T9SS type A sorting domain-containing protein [Paludibacteraceae bacterium]
MKRLAIALLCAALSAFTLVNAEPVASAPYQCSFENEAENAAWSMNSLSMLPDRWFIGNSTSSDGAKSLYVSPKNGENAEMPAYSRHKQGYVLYAVREFKLPTGRYDISFDYKIKGTDKDKFYAFWSPTMPANLSGQTTSVPSNLGTAIVNAKYDVPEWTNAQTSVTANGTSRYLVFVFLAGNGTDPVNNPGACVDNIQIVKHGTTDDCWLQPYQLEFENTAEGTKFTWAGNASAYQLEYFPAANPADITRISDIHGTEYIEPSEKFTDGMYGFRVRATCDNDTSLWASRYNIFIYDITAHCIDFLNLRGENVTCYYGDFNNPFKNREVVDHGYADMTSHHTIHYIDGETDPRTGGGLRTKPDGALASVRLGNWETQKINESAEGIMYKIVRTTGINVIKMNYAVVLQDPNHSYSDQPRFTLELLDEFGNRIDPTCGVVDFIADKNRPGWHTYVDYSDPDMSPAVAEMNSVTWKDWSTIALNLTDMPEVVFVRLSTRDCGLGEHYGYAYFTLDCSDGIVHGTQSCGEVPDRFEVEAGYNYRWFRKQDGRANPIPLSDPRISEDGRVFTPAADDTDVYCVDLIQTNSSTCYFTLEFSRRGLLPMAGVKASWEPKNCQNKLRLINDSKMQEIIEDENGNKTQGDIIEFDGQTEWSVTLPDGSVVTSADKSFVVDLPNEGGEVKVSLKAIVPNTDCFDIKDTTIVVKAIGRHEGQDKKYMCDDGTGFTFNGQHYDKPGHYETVLKTAAGCDSLLTFDLEYLSVQTIRKDTMICDFTAIKPWYEHTFDPAIADATYTHVEKGKGLNCDSLVIEMHVRMRAECCTDSLITQRWNDFLAVRKSKADQFGGFSAYQWYQDGEIMPGQYGPQLYLPEIDITAHTYTVIVTCSADRKMLKSCEFKPTQIGNYSYISISPSVVLNGEAFVNAGEPAQVRIINQVGALVSTQHIGAGKERIEVPQNAGVYLIEVTTLTGARRLEKIMVR